MLFRGTNHVGFTVSNLDRSIEFYTALLGNGPSFRSIYEKSYLGDILGYPGCRLDVAFFGLPGTEVFLELVQFLEPPQRRVDMETYNVGNAHFGLMTDDMDADFERLKKLGGRFRSARPVEIMFGPFKGGKAAFFRDPDNISIELMQSPPTHPG